MEKENHLQNAILGGYVSSLEGIQLHFYLKILFKTPAFSDFFSTTHHPTVLRLIWRASITSVMGTQNDDWNLENHKKGKKKCWRGIWWRNLFRVFIHFWGLKSRLTFSFCWGPGSLALLIKTVVVYLPTPLLKKACFPWKIEDILSIQKPVGGHISR